MTWRTLRTHANREAWKLRYQTPANWPTTWLNQAACNGTDRNMFFHRSRTPEALTMCTGCPVRIQCLHAAYHEEHDLPVNAIVGVRGGLIQADRATVQIELRRRNPDTVNEAG